VNSLRPTPDDGMAPWRHALWILLASTVLRLLLAALVPLFADEAYYWEWSRRLAAGYFDHPPVIAWLVAGGTAILGDTALGVRFVPILFGALLGLAIARTAYHLAGAAAARFAALCLSLAPGWAAGLILATPDSPLLAALACALYAVVRALDDGATPRARLAYWTAAGLMAGLAMASKYTGIFLPIGVAIALVLHPALRRELRGVGPWVAVLVASLVMLPVMWWNAGHDWISFRFQFDHGLAASAQGNWWLRELELFGAQAGLVGVVLFPLALAAVVDAIRPMATWGASDRPATDRTLFAIGVVAAVGAAIFIYSATRRSVEPNWPMIAWIPAIVLLAARRRGRDPARRTPWERRGIWVAGTLTALVIAQAIVPFVPMAPDRDPVTRAYGWDGVAQVVAQEADRLRGDSGTLIVAGNRYQDAALLAWHLHGHPTVLSLNIGGRRNQYDLWPGLAEVAAPGADVLLVLKDTSSVPPDEIVSLAPHFAAARSGQLVELRRGDAIITVRRLWHLVGWKGTLPPPADPTDLFLTR
jgi:4-amino-4-deoxy-L-arabinose transferase-like glycosyltransferase